MKIIDRGSECTLSHSGGGSSSSGRWQYLNEYKEQLDIVICVYIIMSL